MLAFGVFANLIMSLSVTGGAIVYVQNADSDSMLALYDVGQKSATSLGACVADTVPAWSPDGTRIAYCAPADAGVGVRIYNPAVAESVTLKSAFAYCHAPRWDIASGQLCYLVADTAEAPARVAVYNLAEGKEEVWGGELRSAYNPVWMPKLDLFRELNPDNGFTWEGVDTAKLLEEAFSGGVILCTALIPRGGKPSTEIMIVTRTQYAPLLALLGAESGRFMEWNVAPNRDGKMIGFESNDGGDREIFVLGKRGVMDVSNHRAADWNPHWSPKNEWIAFESFRGGWRGVYKIFPETQRVDTVFAPENAQAWSPAWSPDGKDIAFLSDVSGKPEIWILRGGEKNPEQMTNDGQHKAALAWQPELKK